MEVGFVVFEEGVGEMGENGVALEKGLEQVDCLGVQEFRKHVLFESLDLLVVVLFENGLDFEAVFFFVLVGI